MKTYLIRPVNHLKRPVTQLKALIFYFSSGIIMYSEMHILHEDFASIKLLIFQQKEVFLQTKCEYKENGTERNAA